MTDTVDLTNLHEMTDNDKELEIALFEEFYSSSVESIATLEANCTDGENEAWRAAAHALKGAAYNLGAHGLGDHCKNAQESHTASAAQKRMILQAIQEEYVKVKQYLETVYS